MRPRAALWTPLLYNKALREECRLRVFQKTVMSEIFEPKKEEVTGGWAEIT
jgi:hypothetical protein